MSCHYLGIGRKELRDLTIIFLFTGEGTSIRLDGSKSKPMRGFFS